MTATWMMEVAGQNRPRRSAACAELRAEVESARARISGLESELEATQERAEEETTRLQEEVSQLKEKVRGEKEKYSTLWRLNCDRLIAYDEGISAKEEDIARLKAELEASSHPSTVHLPVAIIDSPPHGGVDRVSSLAIFEEEPCRSGVCSPQ